jgi:hypothetical protein
MPTVKAVARQLVSNQRTRILRDLMLPMYSVSMCFEADFLPQYPCITIQGETNIQCRNIQCTRRYVRGTYFVPKATPIDLWVGQAPLPPTYKVATTLDPSSAWCCLDRHLQGLVGGRCISSACGCPDPQHVRRHNSCTRHVPSVYTVAAVSRGSRRMGHSVYEKKPHAATFGLDVCNMVSMSKIETRVAARLGIAVLRFCFW